MHLTTKTRHSIVSGNENQILDSIWQKFRWMDGSSNLLASECYNRAVNKITTLKGAASFSKLVKGKHKTVGLIVGGFDILHLGHTNLFRYAKKHVNFLIVGLDNDKTIRLVKGSDRPVNNFKRRSLLLSDLETIDKIFEIKDISHHDSEEATENYKGLLSTISPTHIFTHKLCDKHWEKKKKIAREMGIGFLLDRGVKITNSGTIIKILSREL